MNGDGNDTLKKRKSVLKRKITVASKASSMEVLGSIHNEKSGF